MVAALAVALGAAPALAQPPLAPAWRGVALAAGSDGGVIAIGQTSVDGLRDVDLWAMRLNSAGEVLWRRALGGPRNDEPWAVSAARDGGALVAAATWPTGWRSRSTRRASSARLWGVRRAFSWAFIRVLREV